MATIFAIPRNNASTTVAGASGYVAGSYSLTLATGGGALFPALTGSNYYRITVCQVAFAYSPTATIANYTIYKVTGVSGDVLTLSSTTLEGTTDRAYSVGDIVEVRVTAGTLSDIHTAVNNLENGAPASSTQFLYNNAGSLAGSAILTQPNSSTVAIKGGTLGTVPLTVTGQTGSISQGTFHDMIRVLRPSDSTVMGSIQLTNQGAGTDYDMLFVTATNFICKPGPSPNNEAPAVQLYCNAAVDHALAFGAAVPGVASGNDLYFSSFVSAGGIFWKELFHCSAIDVTAGSHINIPIYSSGRHGIVINGASGQTADLQQWTDSTPTVLSGVGPAGHIRSVVGAGAPGGTPPTGSMYYDTTNHKIWVYDSGWKGIIVS